MTTREELADEIVGYQIGEGYYSLDIGSAEAKEIVDLVWPFLEKAWQEGAEAQCGQDNGGPMAHNPYTEPEEPEPYDGYMFGMAKVGSPL